MESSGPAAEFLADSMADSMASNRDPSTSRTRSRISGSSWRSRSAIARLVSRLNLDHGLLPIFVLALSLLVYAAAGAFGGSGCSAAVKQIGTMDSAASAAAIIQGSASGGP